MMVRDARVNFPIVSPWFSDYLRHQSTITTAISVLSTSPPTITAGTLNSYPCKSVNPTFNLPKINTSSSSMLLKYSIKEPPFQLRKKRSFYHRS